MKEPLSSVILYTDFIFGVTTMKNKLFGKNIVPDCVYCDNAFFEGSDGGDKPAAKKLLQSPSVFGGFTHSGTLLLFGFEASLFEMRKILGLSEKLLYAEEIPKTLVEASETGSGDIAIRALANSAEAIQKEFEKIKTALTSWRD